MSRQLALAAAIAVLATAALAVLAPATVPALGTGLALLLAK